MCDDASFRASSKALFDAYAAETNHDLEMWFITMSFNDVTLLLQLKHQIHAYISQIAEQDTYEVVPFNTLSVKIRDIFKHLTSLEARVRRYTKSKIATPELKNTWTNADDYMQLELGTSSQTRGFSHRFDPALNQIFGSALSSMDSSAFHGSCLTLEHFCLAGLWPSLLSYDSLLCIDSPLGNVLSVRQFTSRLENALVTLQAIHAATSAPTVSVPSTIFTYADASHRDEALSDEEKDVLERGRVVTDAHTYFLSWAQNMRQIRSAFVARYEGMKVNTLRPEWLGSFTPSNMISMLDTVFCMNMYYNDDSANPLFKTSLFKFESTLSLADPDVHMLNNTSASMAGTRDRDPATLSLAARVPRFGTKVDVSVLGIAVNGPASDTNEALIERTLTEQPTNQAVSQTPSSPQSSGASVSPPTQVNVATVIPMQPSSFTITVPSICHVSKRIMARQFKAIGDVFMKLRQYESAKRFYEIAVEKCEKGDAIFGLSSELCLQYCTLFAAAEQADGPWVGTLYTATTRLSALAMSYGFTDFSTDILLTFCSYITQQLRLESLSSKTKSRLIAAISYAFTVFSLSPSVHKMQIMSLCDTLAAFSPRTSLALQGSIYRLLNCTIDSLDQYDSKASSALLSGLYTEAPYFWRHLTAFLKGWRRQSFSVYGKLRQDATLLSDRLVRSLPDMVTTQHDFVGDSEFTLPCKSFALSPDLGSDTLQGDSLNCRFQVEVCIGHGRVDSKKAKNDVKNIVVQSRETKLTLAVSSMRKTEAADFVRPLKEGKVTGVVSAIQDGDAEESQGMAFHILSNSYSPLSHLFQLNFIIVSTACASRRVLLSGLLIKFAGRTVTYTFGVPLHFVCVPAFPRLRMLSVRSSQLPFGAAATPEDASESCCADKRKEGDFTFKYIRRFATLRFSLATEFSLATSISCENAHGIRAFLVNNEQVSGYKHHPFPLESREDYVAEICVAIEMNVSAVIFNLAAILGDTKIIYRICTSMRHTPPKIQSVETHQADDLMTVLFTLPTDSCATLQFMTKGRRKITPRIVLRQPKFTDYSMDVFKSEDYVLYDTIDGHGDASEQMMDVIKDALALTSSTHTKNKGVVTIDITNTRVALNKILESGFEIDLRLTGGMYFVGKINMRSNNIFHVMKLSKRPGVLRILARSRVDGGVFETHLVV